MVLYCNTLEKTYIIQWEVHKFYKEDISGKRKDLK